MNALDVHVDVHSVPGTRAQFLTPIVAGAVFMFYLTAALIRFETGRVTTWDFGYFSQILWLIGHGHWAARSTLNGHLALTDAGSAILYPIGWLYPHVGAIGLFVLQAAALASGIPFLSWWLSRYGAGARFKGAIFGLYALYPAVIGPALFDWHPDVFAIPAAFYAMWAIETGRSRHYWIAVLALLTTKVTAAFLVLGLAVPWAVRRQWSMAVVSAAVGVAAAVGEVDLLFPWLTGHTMAQWTQYYGWLGPTPLAGVLYIFQHPFAVLGRLARPSDLAYLVLLLGPVGVIPAFYSFGGWAVPAWLMIGFNLLSAFPGQYNPFNQYSTTVAPFLVVSLIVLVSRLRMRQSRWALAFAAMAGFSGLAWATTGLPLVWAPTVPSRALADAVAAVPRQAPLYGENSTLARLSNRWFVRLLPLPTRVAPGTDVILTTQANPANGITSSAVIAATWKRLRSHRATWHVAFHQQSVWVYERESSTAPRAYGQSAFSTVPRYP